MSHWPHHPDDEPSPRFGGWADDFATFDDACRFYGCDTPAQVEAEMEYRHAEWVAEDAAFIGPRLPEPVYPGGEIPF